MKEPIFTDHPAEVMKPPHVDVQVVEVKEEPTWTEEAQDMLQQDPLALNPEPVSWQSSDSQEEPQPQGTLQLGLSAFSSASQVSSIIPKDTQGYKETTGGQVAYSWW